MEDHEKSKDQLLKKIVEIKEELKQTKNQLNQTVKERDLYKNILNKIPAYIFVLSEDYTVLYSNQYFNDIFGQADNYKCHEYINNSKVPCKKCKTISVLETKKSIQWEKKVNKGNIFQVHNFYIDEFYDNPAVLEIAFDVTDYKNLQEQLKENSESLEKLVSSRTQELNLTINKLENEILERNTIENQLNESKEKYKQLAEAVNAGIVIHDHGIIIEANDLFFEMLGYDQDELLGREAASFLLTPDSLNALNYRVEQEVTENYELTFIRKDGSQFLAEIHTKYMIHNGKKVRGGVIYDITNKKNIEAELRENNTRLRLALSSMNAGTWEWDLQNNELYLNKKALEIFDIEHPKFSRKFNDWKLKIYFEDLTRVLDNLLEAFKSGHYEDEYRISIKDNQLKYIQSSAIAIKDDLGNDHKLIGLHIDITEKKLIELELTKFNDRLNNIIEAIKDGFFVLDDNIKVLYFNKAAEKLLNKKREEVLGLHLFDEAFPEAKGSIFEEKYLYALNEKVFVTFEFFFNTPPYVNWYDVDVYPFEDGISIFFKVTTERKKEEQEKERIHLELQQAYQQEQQLREEMVSTYEELESAYEEITISQNELTNLLQKLHLSEERLKQLVENMPVIMNAYDDNELIVAWNKEAERVTGFTANEVIGNPKIFDLLYPDSTYYHSLKEEIITKDNNYRDWEIEISCKNGDRKTISWSNISKYYPIPDWENWSIGTDITKRKIIENSLIESEKKFRTLFNNMLNGFIYLKLVKNNNNELIDYLIIEINEAAIKILELNKSVILGKGIHDLIPSVDKQGKNLFKTLDHAINNKSKSELEFLSAEIGKWLSLTAYSYEENYLAIIFEDITERKNNESIRLTYLHFLENLDIIDRAIRDTSNPHDMVDNAIKSIRSIFDCDRVLLTNLSDPTNKLIYILFEDSNPIYPISNDQKIIKIEEDFEKSINEALNYQKPVLSNIETLTDYEKSFSIQSQIITATLPQSDKPWILVLQQCSYPRKWTEEEINLFKEIGRRIGEALNIMLVFQDLQKSEERYRSLIEQMTEGIIIVDSTRRIRYINPVMLRKLGYLEEELYGKYVDIVFDEKNMSIVHKNFKKRFIGSSESYELEWLTKNNKKIITIMSPQPLYDEDGKFNGSFSVVTDITDRKIAEEERDRFFILSIDIIAISDFNGIIRRVNPISEKLLGYTNEEITSVPFSSFIYEEDLLSTDKVMTKVKEGNPVSYFENRIVCKDGSINWYAWSFNPYLEEKVYYSIGRDITDKKQVEQEIINERNKAQTYLDITGTILLALDRDANITLINKKGCELLKSTEEELIGKNWINTFIPETVREMVQKVFSLIMSGQIKLVEYYENDVLNSKKELIPVAWHNSIIYGENGEPIGTLSSGEDITHRIEAQQLLIQERNKAQTYLDIAGVMLMALDLEGNITLINKKGCELLGYLDETNIIGLNWFNHFIPESNQDKVKYVFSLFMKGEPKHFEYFENEIINKNGELIILAWHNSIIYDENDKPIGTLSSGEDISERIRVQQQLIFERNKVQTYLDTAGVMLMALELDGTVSLINKKGCEILGYSKEQIVGKNWFEHFLPKHNANKVKDFFYKVIIGEIDLIEYHENEIINSKGEERDIAWHNSLLKNESGKIIAGFTSGEDITDRKKAEQRLKESETRLAEAQHIAKLGNWMYNPSTETFEWSDEVYNILGLYNLSSPLPYEEQIKRIHPNDKEIFKNIYQLMESQTESFEIEFRYIKPDNSLIYLQVKSKPHLDDQGKILNVYGTIQDISEIKLAQLETDKIRKYLKNIFDSMPSVLVSVDSKSRITQWNIEAEKETGLTSKQAIGKKVDEVLPNLSNYMDKLEKALKDYAPQREEKVYSEVEGQPKYNDIMVYPLIANGIEGAVIRIDDITSRVRIENMMIQTEKMMSVGGLAAGMAHEINNPLGGILQSAQNILRRISPDLKKNKAVANELELDLNLVYKYFEKRDIISFINGIREAGLRASKIVSNMLQFSRRSETRLTINDLHSLIDQAIELAENDYDLKKKYDFRHIKIVKEYDERIPKIKIAQTEIEQVILNLLKNSAQAMENNKIDNPPTIRIKTKLEQNNILLEVEDNGIGMDENVRKRVFEPFFTTKEVGTGTGLGLSVSFMIITNFLKGTIQVESTPMKGTKFLINLPLIKEKTNG